MNEQTKPKPSSKSQRSRALVLAARRDEAAASATEELSDARKEQARQQRLAALTPRFWPSRKTVDELSGFQEIRICPWTTREIIRHPNAMRYPNSYRYRDTGKACPWRVAYAAGFRPPQPQTETHYA